MSLAVLILTYNEELHIERLLDNIKSIATTIYVIDSGSTDRTLSICESFGVRIFFNKFESHSRQVNWAIKNCGIEERWTLRLDADEYLLPELKSEVSKMVSSDDDSDLNGVFLRRRNMFMGKWIRFGGYYPVRILRLWRTGFAECDGRYMDEHMKILEGSYAELNGDFIDHNLRPISWWIEKHNWYATKEAAEIAWNESEPVMTHIHNTDKSMEPRKDSASLPTRVKIFKVLGYNQAPLLLRCGLYFFYRYFIRLGFLDGKRGLIFHFLQGFWYRVLVDVKVIEIRRLSAVEQVSLEEAVLRLHGISR